MLNEHKVDYVIAPFSFHRQLLLNRRGKLDHSYQLLTKEQFLQATSFTVDVAKAYEVFLTHEQLPPSLASLYISLLTFIPPDHDHKKVQQLRRYYQLLVDHQAITFPRFSDVKFSHKRVAVLGYLEEDRVFNERLHAFSMHVTYDRAPVVEEGCIVDRLETIGDEVTLFLNRVCALYEQGVSSHQIVLIQPPREYRYELERQAAYFNVPLALPSEETLFDLPLTQAFLNQDQPYETFLQTSKDSFPLEQVDQLHGFLNTIPHAIRHSAYVKDYVRLLTQDIRLRMTTFENAIRVVPLGPFDPSMHVFILGFAQGNVPRIHRDIGWLDDRLKHSLGLFTSQQLNAQEERWIRYTLSHRGPLYISRSHHSPTGVVLSSPLVDTFKMNEVDRSYTEDHVDYSQELGKIRKRLYEEKWMYYRYQHPYLQSLKHAYPHDEPRFHYYPTPVNHPVPQPLKLSYSSVNEYYQCGFKYFVSRVLKVEPYDPDEFYMHLGTFAHDVFEHMRGDLSSFSTVFDQRLDQALLTSKERILFRHLKPKLEEVARFNDHHQRHMTQPTFIEEMPISIPIDEHTVLQGVIDRTILLSDEHGNEYVALMDYKSGSESFDGSLMEYGWSLQLPIYALMIHAHPELKHRELLGVFIQHILHKSMKKNVIEIGKDIFPTTYQLDGVVVSETKKAALLDRNLGNQPSLFLQATKPASLEYLKENAHVVSSSYLASMQTTAKTKIIEASGHIRSRHYPLNPRTIKNKSSCDYCPFQDVCFRQSQDVTIIRVKKEEDTSDESN